MNALDLTKCESANEMINLMQKDIKRRKSICFKIKKFFKNIF